MGVVDLEYEGYILVECPKCKLKIKCYEPLAANALIGWRCPRCKKAKLREVKSDD